MSIKTVAKVVILLGLIVAIFEGVPQRTGQWLKSTEFGAKWLPTGGEQSLPGPLRGLLDPNANSHLTTTGVAEYTNNHREDNGLTPLHYNAKLAKAAEAKIDDMFAKQYFEHESPDGKNPADIISAAGYEYIIVGENLALGNFQDDATLVQAWMDSPGHRANILNAKFAEIGVAVRKGEFEGKTVWLAVQEFGSPLSSCPSPQSGLKAEIDSNRAQLASMQSDLQRQKEALEADRYESREEYNRAVERYNALARQINQLTDETQRLVQAYNQRVNEFNACLEQNS